MTAMMPRPESHCPRSVELLPRRICADPHRTWSMVSVDRVGALREMLARVED